jgi:hypothetical protein
MCAAAAAEMRHISALYQHMMESAWCLSPPSPRPLFHVLLIHRHLVLRALRFSPNIFIPKLFFSACCRHCAVSGFQHTHFCFAHRLIAINFFTKNDEQIGWMVL